MPDCPKISSMVSRIQRSHWACNSSGAEKGKLPDSVSDCLILASIDKLLDFSHSIGSGCWDLRRRW